MSGKELETTQGKSLPEYWGEFRRYTEERLKRGKPSMPTGIAWLDERTDGFHKGQLYTIAGKSGSGKTTLALQMASHLATYDKAVLFVSLEMKGEDLVARMFCEKQGVDFNRLRVGDYPEGFDAKEKDFLNYLSHINFEIVEFGYTVESIIKIISSFYPDTSPDLMVIDFAQLVDIGARDERTALQEFVRKITELAKKKNIAILLISQVRRQPAGGNYDKELDMMDLKGTSSLEHLSSVVIMVQHLKVISIEGTKEGYQLRIVKNRFGEIGSCDIEFRGSQFKFIEIQDVLPPPIERKDWK